MSCEIGLEDLPNELLLPIISTHPRQLLLVSKRLYDMRYDVPAKNLLHPLWLTPTVLGISVLSLNRVVWEQRTLDQIYNNPREFVREDLKYRHVKYMNSRVNGNTITCNGNTIAVMRDGSVIIKTHIKDMYVTAIDGMLMTIEFPHKFNPTLRWKDIRICQEERRDLSHVWTVFMINIGHDAYDGSVPNKSNFIDNIIACNIPGLDKIRESVKIFR